MKESIALGLISLTRTMFRVHLQRAQTHGGITTEELADLKHIDDKINKLELELLDQIESEESDTNPE